MSINAKSKLSENAGCRSASETLSMLAMIVALCLLLCPIAANAAWRCDVVKPNYAISLPSVITIPKGLSPGQAITGWFSSGGMQVAYICDGNFYNVTESTAMSASGQTYQEGGITYVIYRTSLDGVGVVIKATGQGMYIRAGTYSFPYPGTWVSTWYQQPVDIKFGVEAKLIKLSKISTGEISAMAVGNIKSFGMDGKSSPVIPIALSQARVVARTCAILTPSVAVNFRDVQKSQFDGVGRVVGLTAFKVELDCSDGTDVTARLNADKDQSVANGTAIKISGAGGAARGIAVQLIDRNGLAIKIGESFFAGRSAGGVFDLGLQAQYVQTSASVGAGSVYAIATIDFDYD